MAHKKIETSIDATITYQSEGAVTGLPDTLDKGQTVIVSAEITTVNPFSDISFLMFNPLGYDDIFNIGKPELTFGNSFACSETAEWEPLMQKSLSGNSVGLVEYNLPIALNTDMERNITNSENKISLKFPLMAMDGYTEGQYVFSVVMKVGDEDVITVTQDINITETVHSPTVGSGEISLGTPTLLGTAYAGGSAAFQIDITVPAGKTFELKTSGSISNAELKPLGLAIISPGLCSGFQKEAIFEDSIDSTFGTVTNADDKDSIIKLMVVFELTNAASGSIIETISIDGVSVYLNGDIISAASEVEDVMGSGTGLGLASIMAGLASGVQSEVILPSSILSKDLTFHAFPDYDGNFNLRLCRIEVDYVGLGHPCTIPFKDSSYAQSFSTFSKSVDTKKYDDSITVNLGKSCPVQVPNDRSINNTVSFSFYYDIPSDETVTSNVDIALSGGLYVDDTALWTTLYEIKTVATSSFSGIEAWNSNQTLTKPYMTARIMDEITHLDAVFGIRFVLKINKLTRGKLIFEVSTGDQDLSEFCSLKIVSVGNNFGCAKSPEEFTRKHTTFQVRNSDGFINKGILTINSIMNYGSTDLESNMYADDNSIELKAFFKRKTPEETPINIDATLNGETKVIAVPVTDSQALTVEGSLDFDFITITDNDPINQMPLLAAKTLGIEVAVPKFFSGAIKIRFADKDFSKKITLCSLHVTKVGKNLPCFSGGKLPISDNGNSVLSQYYHSATRGIVPMLNETSKVELDDLENPRYYKEMTININLCQHDFEGEPNENKFQVEFTFKANDNAVNGDVINIETEIVDLENDNSLVIKDIALEISETLIPDLLVSNTSFPEVMENTTTEIAIGTFIFCILSFYFFLILRYWKSSLGPFQHFSSHIHNCSHGTCSDIRDNYKF